MSEIYRATEPFAYTDKQGVPRSVCVGDLMSGDDPNFKGKEGLYELVQVAAARASKTETTSAGPGESRSRSKRLGRAKADPDPTPAEPEAPETPAETE